MIKHDFTTIRLSQDMDKKDEVIQAKAKPQLLAGMILLIVF